MLIYLFSSGSYADMTGANICFRLLSDPHGPELLSCFPKGWRKMKSHRKLTQVLRAESDKGYGPFEKSDVERTVVTSRGHKLNSLMDRLHGEMAFMISKF